MKSKYTFRVVANVQSTGKVVRTEVACSMSVTTLHREEKHRAQGCRIMRKMGHVHIYTDICVEHEMYCIVSGMIILN